MEENTIIRDVAMKWLTSARVENLLIEKQTRACSYSLYLYLQELHKWSHTLRVNPSNTYA